MDLDFVFYSLLSLAIIFLIYTLNFAIKAHNLIGRFASCVDAEAFSRSYNLTLHVNTTDRHSIFGSKSKIEIFLFYNKHKLAFSPIINRKLTFVASDQYSDFFYDSLAYILGDEKREIVRRVKRYLMKNFWRMKSFYRILFDFRALNFIFGKPILQFVPQNILKDPDKVLHYIPRHSREGAKLTLLDIDRFSNKKIFKLYNHDSVEKWIFELKKLLKVVKYNRNYKLSQIDTLHVGEPFSTQLSNASNQRQFIEEEIIRCQNNREGLPQIGSDLVGDCKLHALGAKLSSLFAADIIDIFTKSQRSDKRIIFRFEQPGFLFYYTTLYHHQYKLIAFARKLQNFEDEMMFLACFNKAKYEVNPNSNKFDCLMNLLQKRWSLFDRKTQIHLTHFQNEMKSLFFEL